MSVSDYKIMVFKEIMDIDNELALKQIYQLVHQFVVDYKQITNKKSKSEKISFEEWNKQFEDDMDLDEFIPEYGMTLREFRMAIYEAEMGDEMTMEEFKESLKTWL
jgi:hypothetical protein